MREIELNLDPALYVRLHAHLLRQRNRNEQAAFLLCKATVGAAAASFACFDAVFIKHQQFAIHSAFHLELDDITRARVIKAAHDQRCSLVEVHSHPWSESARFSASDFDGLAEFVPHVWWRLRHRPYGAVVITPTSIDGLAWIEGPVHAERIHALKAGGQVRRMSGLSFRVLTGAVNEAIRSQ